MSADDREEVDLADRLREYESASRRDLLLSPDLLADMAFAMAKAWPAARSRVNARNGGLMATVKAVASLHRARAKHAADSMIGAEDEQAAADLTALVEAWGSPAPGDAEPRRAWDSHTSAVVHAAWQTGAADLLEAVIAVWQAMAAAGVETSDGNELGRHVAMLLNLGSALGERFHRTGHTVDLNSAVTVLHDARHHAREAPELIPAVLAGLAEALRQRYGALGRPADLDEAVELGKKAVAVGADDVDRALYLYELADGYLGRFARDGDPAAVNLAVDALREAVALTPLASADHPSRRSRLIDALTIRFEHFHDRNDLTEALGIAEAAVVESQGMASRARANSDLAGVLLARLADSGHDGDLRRAVDAARAAANEATKGDVNHPHYCNQLSLLLRMLFERTRSLSDLHEAIYAGRLAVRNSPPGSPDLTRRRSNLGFALTLLAERTGSRNDVESAVEAGTEAVTAIPAGHPDRPIALSNFAAAHDLRRRLWPNVEADLDTAIEALREAVTEAPAGHPVRPVFLSNLSTSLVSRHRKTGSARDRSEALAAIERALRECAPQSPDLAGFQFNLALVLELGGAAAESSAGARVVEAFRSAARNEVAPVRIRALAARGWADKAAENGEWEESLAAYTQALSHAQAWAWHGAERDDTFAALEEIAGVANDAAAVAIRLGRLEHALGLLEQGHGVAYSRAVGLNADRVALRAARPDLAERVDRIRQSLDAPSDPERAAVEQTTIGLRLRQNLARDWDDVLAEVRREPEFADFLRPPRLGDVVDLADQGPVVVVNISKHQCDALLVTTAGISAMPMPGLTSGAARRQASLLLAALNSRKLPGPFRDQAERTARRVLAWIWDVIAEPVTAALGFTGAGRTPDDLPRIWWYPTGVARFLPLHAAGRHPNQPPAAGRWRSSALTMLHRAKSSYLPTLSALTKARARPAPDLAAAVLIVAVADAPGLPPLEGVSLEVERIQPHFVNAKLLESRGATRAALLANLPGSHILHFAGHGDQPPKRGAHGVLMTHDFHQTGPVSMADIARLDLSHADLAFLSACETARGDAALADESVHVAGALHMAGFTHTIGTRWVTGDYASAEISDYFYRYLREVQRRTETIEHSDVAAALHTAMIRLYHECAHLPLVWAQYVHTGP